MTNSIGDVRHAELVQWEAETGQSLPLPIDTIIDLENRGHCVDLVDGSIVWNVDDLRFDKTVIFDALNVVLDVEPVDEGGAL